MMNEKKKRDKKIKTFLLKGARTGGYSIGVIEGAMSSTAAALGQYDVAGATALGSLSGLTVGFMSDLILNYGDDFSLKTVYDDLMDEAQPFKYLFKNTCFRLK